MSRARRVRPRIKSSVIKYDSRALRIPMCTLVWYVCASRDLNSFSQSRTACNAYNTYIYIYYIYRYKRILRIQIYTHTVCFTSRFTPLPAAAGAAELPAVSRYDVCTTFDRHGEHAVHIILLFVRCIMYNILYYNM